MLKKAFFIASLMLAVPAFANAGCVYNGKVYPEGTVIGPYTCSNGKWV